MDVAAWQAQLRKGAAELAVLALVRPGECYGSQILERVNAGGQLVTEGALYPLLSRLEREGRLASRWTVEEAAAPRKYYRLTPQGRSDLQSMSEAWTTFKTAMSQLVEHP